MQKFRLSVLDQSPVAAGSTGGQALRNTLDLARAADRLGYHRYWLAEHHGTPALAGAAPEVMVGVVAAATERIRVGSGGVMLPHYSPFKVAETFSMLASLFPGRIDLGLGRAPGTDGRTALALQRDRRQRAPYDFPDALDELLGYLDGTLEPDHPFAPLAEMLPGRPEVPAPWLLGSSPDSAMWAAAEGLPYCFAQFINPEGGARIAASYRERFRPSARLASPVTVVAVWTICADTAEEAERLASSSRMMFHLLHTGRLVAVPPVEEALRYIEAEGLDLEQQAQPGPLGVRTGSRTRKMVIGDPADVRRGIEEVAGEFGADEVMLVNILHDHEARRRSYELVAQEFGLEGARQAQTVTA
jgi:luciferase family oxidoreductase group 1